MLGLDKARNLRGDFIQQIHRQAQHALGYHVGRGQDGRHHGDDQDDVFAVLGQGFVGDLAVPRQHVDDHRQLKHDAEGQHKGEYKVKVLLDRPHGRGHAVAGLPEQIHRQREHIDVAEHHAGDKQQQHHKEQPGEQLFFVCVQRRGYKGPDLLDNHRHADHHGCNQAGFELEHQRFADGGGDHLDAARAHGLQHKIHQRGAEKIKQHHKGNQHGAG